MSLEMGRHKFPEVLVLLGETVGTKCGQNVWKLSSKNEKPYLI